jgi:hypothetical protein
MRSPTLLAAGTGVLLACTAEPSPTEPDGARSAPSDRLAAAASNTWSLRAARPGSGVIFQSLAGTAPNSAGESIVYVFGGRDGEGGTGFGGSAYNVSTDTWTGGRARVQVFSSNGVGKIGNRLYFAGGYNTVGTPDVSTNQLRAYDYANDRFISKAPLPIFGAEGVSGVISGKLYVLPGVCAGDGYPNPGYCVEEPNRRFFRYDPSTNSWASRRQSPHVHRLGAAAVIGGKLYVAGGFNGFTPVTALDAYDPATNQWQTLAPLPRGGQAIGAALQGRFHVLVGTSHYSYEPRTNRWKALAPSQYAHEALLRVELDGRAHLLAVGGIHGPHLDMPNPTELYTP